MFPNYHASSSSRRVACNQCGAEHDVPLPLFELAEKHGIFPTVLVCDKKKDIDIQEINDEPPKGDLRYYRNPLFDRFRRFRTTDNPHSLQNIILRKQIKMLARLRVANYEIFRFSDFSQNPHFITTHTELSLIV